MATTDETDSFKEVLHFEILHSPLESDMFLSPIWKQSGENVLPMKKRGWDTGDDGKQRQSKPGAEGQRSSRGRSTSACISLYSVVVKL